MTKVNTATTSYLKFNEPSRVVVDEGLSDIHSHDCYRVNGCITFYVDNRDKEYWVNIPHGYQISDYVVPKWIAWLLPPNKECGKAMIVYHYLCNVGKVRIRKNRLLVDRTEARRIFLQAMKVAGVGFFRRWMIYSAAYALSKVDAGKELNNEASC